MFGPRVQQCCCVSRLPRHSMLHRSCSWRRARRATAHPIGVRVQMSTRTRHHFVRRTRPGRARQAETRTRRGCVRRPASRPSRATSSSPRRACALVACGVTRNATYRTAGPPFQSRAVGADSVVKITAAATAHQQPACPPQHPRRRRVPCAPRPPESMRQRPSLGHRG